MAEPQTIIDRIQALSDEDKSKYAFYGVAALGLYLLWKNRSPNEVVKERKLDNLSDDEISRRVKMVLTSHVGTDESLNVMARKLDKKASHFEQGAVDRGTRFEMRRIKNQLVAKNQVIKNLTEDPGYYDSLEDVG